VITALDVVVDQLERAAIVSDKRAGRLRRMSRKALKHVKAKAHRLSSRRPPRLSAVCANTLASAADLVVDLENL
jgi:hypothetical protein